MDEEETWFDRRSEDEKRWIATAIETVTSGFVFIAIWGVIGATFWFNLYFGFGVVFGMSFMMILERLRKYLHRENLRDMSDEEIRETLTLVKD